MRGKAKGEKPATRARKAKSARAKRLPKSDALRIKRLALWHDYRERQGMSFGEIADLVGKPKSTVAAGVATYRGYLDAEAAAGRAVPKLPTITRRDRAEVLAEIRAGRLSAADLVAGVEAGRLTAAAIDEGRAAG